MLYLPSIILVIIAIVSDSGMWGYIGAFGWIIFITAILTAFNILPKFNYESKTNKTMKWTTKRTASWLELHSSYQHERIVKVNKGVPTAVMPKGKFRVGLVRYYDELVLVDLRPKLIKIDFSEKDQITTSDSVLIGGTISIKARVRDNDEIILKLVSNEIEEDETLLSYLKLALKTVISNQRWIELAILNSKVYDQLKDGISIPLSKINLCFQIDDLIEINLSPIDKEFAQLLEQRQKEIENTKLKIEKLQSEEKAQKIKADIERERITREFENEKLTQDNKIKLEEERVKFEIKTKKEALEIENAQKKALAKLQREIYEDGIKLLKNPEALAILNPDLYRDLELKKIEMEIQKEITIQKSQENIFKLILDAKNAKRDGIIEGISGFAPENIGLNVKQIISNSDENDLKIEIERLRKENEELKSNKSNENKKEE